MGFPISSRTDSHAGRFIHRLLRPDAGRALAALALLALPASASAQEADPFPWVAMTTVGVEPGAVEEFLAAQRELAALDRRAGAPWRSVSRTAVFGDAYRFLILTPLRNFAGLDRSPGADPVRARVMSRIERVVTGRTTLALRTTPDLDDPLPEDEEPALMIVQTVSVTPGREQEYLRVMAEEVLPHFEAAAMRHRSGALTLGGESGFVHFFHVGNFAALDQGSPLARALGPQGAQEVATKLAGVVTRTEQWLVRPVPDASFRAEPETESPESASRDRR